MTQVELEFASGALRPFYESSVNDAVSEAALWRDYFRKTRDQLVAGGAAFVATEPLRAL